MQCINEHGTITYDEDGFIWEAVPRTTVYKLLVAFMETVPNVYIDTRDTQLRLHVKGMYATAVVMKVLSIHEEEKIYPIRGFELVEVGDDCRLLHIDGTLDSVEATNEFIANNLHLFKSEATDNAFPIGDYENRLVGRAYWYMDKRQVKNISVCALNSVLLHTDIGTK